MIVASVAVAAATYAIDKPYHYEVPPEFLGELQPGMRVLLPFGRGNRRSEGMVLSLGEQAAPSSLKKILALLDDAPVLTEEGIKLSLWLREWYFSTVYTAVLSMLPTGMWYRLRDTYTIAPGVAREHAFAAAGKSRAAKALLELIFASGGEAELSQILNAFELKNPRPALAQLLQDGILRLETGAHRQVKDKTEKIAILTLPAEEAMELVKKRRQSAPMRYQVTELLCALGSAPVKEIRYFTGASMETIKSLERSGILKLELQEIFRRAIPAQSAPPPEIILNQEQETACSGLQRLLQSGKPEAALLYGVTGSGKTEVYLRLIQSVLDRGKTALVLVPEIALTTKLLELFVSFFAEKVAILHSGLPMGERYDEWKRIRRGEARVVLGTRSAVFAPLEDLALIVLDEEQESSYHSETMLRYHARDVAKFRCTFHKALFLSVSATPSIESMYAAEQGSYHRFLLRKRYNEQALPPVYIADMREELKKGNATSLSGRLCKELEENFARGEQSILFLNRRGSSRMVSCGECGEAPTCPRCSVYLTYHEANGRLMCHHCGHSEKLMDWCASCGGRLHFIGLGTQKVEADLKERYPEIALLRMDTDTVTAARSHEAILDRFVQKRIPILLGTQMVAKGLDFENVTLVGVISADLSLYVDHYQAAERSFSLLTQVVGRAGRGEKDGRAVIQTFTPNHDVINLAAKQDYDSFFQMECELRRLRAMPPFGDLFRITVAGPDEAAVLRVCMNLRVNLEHFQKQAEQEGGKTALLGPAPASVLKVNNRYRYHLTLTAKNQKYTRNWIADLLRAAQADPATRGITISADINPPD